MRKGEERKGVKTRAGACMTKRHENQVPATHYDTCTPTHTHADTHITGKPNHQRPTWQTAWKTRGAPTRAARAEERPAAKMPATINGPQKAPSIMIWLL